MLKIESVLCPLDFSETSGLAYDYAQSIAQHYDTPLYLEHIIEPFASVYNYTPLRESWDDVRTREAREHLRRFEVAHRHGERPSEAVVQEGPVPESILQFARKRNVSLIVMGPHERPGIEGMLGSVTERVMRKSGCPVLAVRRGAHGSAPATAGRDFNPRRIILCTDFSRPSSQALGSALALAMEFGSELTAVHVLENIPPDADFQKVSEGLAENITGLIPAEAADWCESRATVRIGKPYLEIVQLALEEQADLIVMGVRGRNALNLAMFGSTTHRVIQMAPCPVLAVHSSQIAA